MLVKTINYPSWDVGKVYLEQLGHLDNTQRYLLRTCILDLVLSFELVTETVK